MLTESILSTKKDDFDIIFIQEPPWNLIHHVLSTKEPLGNELMGTPIHPEWTYMVHPSNPCPCVLTYVHTWLQVMRPTLRRDLINSRDIQVLSLQTKDGKTLFLLNVYLDDKFRAIKLLDCLTGSLPLFFYMGGDFNCRSRIWDQHSTHDSFHVNQLIEVASSLGLSLSLASTPYVPTHFPFNRALNSFTIDLVFSSDNFPLPVVTVVPEECLFSDHTPMTVSLPLTSTEHALQYKTLPKDSEEELCFLNKICDGLRDLKDLPLNMESDISLLFNTFHARVSLAFEENARNSYITHRSKLWWNNDCSTCLDIYRQCRSKLNWSAFHKATHSAKWSFFNQKIEEITTENHCPWDLMSWVKMCKLPAIDAIRYQGQPCNTPGELWNGLQNTYNSAQGRPASAVLSDILPAHPHRSWMPFTMNKLEECLRTCSNTSAPGPDHLTWQYLKSIVIDNDCANLFLCLGNACISIGSWPDIFKESVSIIIPKPGKPQHDIPKMFHPIVLLNTLGKLFEKMLAQKMQYDTIHLGIFHSNQLGEIKQ
jgi:endonuclease/exonuclease/phosphatase family metal-dependent hydrolase